MSIAEFKLGNWYRFRVFNGQDDFYTIGYLYSFSSLYPKCGLMLISTDCLSTRNILDQKIPNHLKNQFCQLDICLSDGPRQLTPAEAPYDL